MEASLKQACTQMCGGLLGYRPPPMHLEIKKATFYTWDDVSGFTGFTLLPKSATEIRLPLLHSNFKKMKHLRSFVLTFFFKKREIIRLCDLF
jgi:hypothetical protein